MFDVAWSGHSEMWGGTKASLGKLRPQEVVFAPRGAALADKLEVAEVRSYVDGLSRWTRASAISTESEHDGEGRVQSVTIRLTGESLLTWSQGAATMELKSHWTHSPVRDGVTAITTLADSVTLESRFESGSRPFWDHFVEQRKVANLLVFLFGGPIFFRRHQVRDQVFREHYGDRVHLPFRELLSRNTFRDRTRPVPSTKDLGRPLVAFETLGAAGLTRWAEVYEKWARFILPSVAILRRREAYVEDRVISTSLSMEAAGRLLGPRDGERETLWKGRPTTATFAYRCLRELDLVWPTRTGALTGMARALAHNYNKLKHADRGEFPDNSETYLVSSINAFVVRSLALSLTCSSGSLREVLQQSSEMSELAQLFDEERLSILIDGSWKKDDEREGASPASASPPPAEEQ